MSIKTYTGGKSAKKTPQSEPIPGSAMVANSAGGFTFEVDKWAKLDRLLVLGTEGGSYYASEKKLTTENIANLILCLKADGLRTVKRIVEISEEGRAPKNDPALFALAVALKQGDEATKREAKAAVPRVARIGTHVFALASSVQSLGGWGRGTRSAFANWFTAQDPNDLALNLIKYQSRDGWSNRDLLRLSHAKAKTETQNELFKWAVKGWDKIGPEEPKDAALTRIWAFERAKKAKTAKEIVELINQYHLPRECVPTEFLNDVSVWGALLDNGGKGMPITAMIRNLGKMTSVGLIKPFSEASKKVVAALGNADLLKKGRVHPLSILIALRTYERGHGEKGSLTWVPDKNVVEAADSGFYLAFKAVEPTNKRRMFCLDVSGSMGGGSVAGSPLTPREASIAMAMVGLNVEPWTHIIGFTGGSGNVGHSRYYDVDSRQSPDAVEPLNISKKDRLTTAINYVKNLPMGATDCALPMIYALKRGLEVDVFEVYTDSETWAGTIQPVQALREYRKVTGIPAKLVVVGMVSNGFTIADPNDAGMLDVVGFDTATPSVISEFIK
jgi:60 kDa SS-A/Ro ribonucleoprotein